MGGTDIPIECTHFGQKMDNHINPNIFNFLCKSKNN